MSQIYDLLDLSIILALPLPDTPPQTLASVTLSCELLKRVHTGVLLPDLITDEEQESLRWYLEEYWKWPYLEFATRGRQVEALLVDIGKRLYHTVSSSPEAQRIVKEWRSQSNVRHQISIVSEIPRVLSLPWELLYDEHGFLALRPDQPTLIVRRLPEPKQAAYSASFESPLRVLLITARPEGIGFIDPRTVARALMDEVEGQVEAGNIEIEFLRPPTLSALRSRLKNAEKPIHVLHFDGHGEFDEEEEQQGILFFETEAGLPSPVNASTLARVLRDAEMRLVVLTACESALSATDDAFSSVAAQLIHSGVGAVVAMSASFLVASATRYVEVFYRTLVEGASASMAHEQAQQALHEVPYRHLQRRRGDEVGKPVMLYDWWLPQFYQRYPVALRFMKPEYPSGQPALASSVSRLRGEVPAAPRYGFSGQTRELMWVERSLLWRKIVVIHGFGGGGKTALAHEAADWLTRTKFYKGACFVSFERGGGTELLLGALANYLGESDDHSNPYDVEGALARLRIALEMQRPLVVADSLENILPGGKTPLDAALRTQVWDVMLRLAAMGVGVLLTSRDITFEDARLTSGNKVRYLTLKGLRHEDAYVFATRLLDDLEIDRVNVPYTELRDLLAQLDHHPLAIQLVLPTLREQTLAVIRTRFSTLLPTFVDNAETGRNRSLVDSLHYSLQRLSEEQRVSLPQLAPFEGGASESQLLTITQIPKGEWMKLRSALERVALLMVEPMKGVKSPFLHFHPVLAPYLRNVQNPNDADLYERYVKSYYNLAQTLYSADTRNPLSARVYVRRELPNLQRVLELLLETGKLDDAIDMANSVSSFMSSFGLVRERDELRRRVTEAVIAVGAHGQGALTRAEYLREKGMGDDELEKGNLQAAYDRFTRLLTHIEALPEGMPLGRGSHEHLTTLHSLARCLNEGDQSAAAEDRLRVALSIIDTLLEERSNDQDVIHHRGQLLITLGNVRTKQGQYAQAQEAYEEGLKVITRQSDLQTVAIVLAQLGLLASRQQDYAKAMSRYTEARELFHALHEPAMEAGTWHQLGIIAQEQADWAEAERCYRESLTIKELLGDVAGAAITCNNLGLVVRLAGRPSEATGWFKQALEFDQQLHPQSPSHANHLNNLADLLVSEVRAGHAPVTTLAEARDYAERALKIKEALDESSGVWNPLGILADIADLEGQTELARFYRSRERETYAAFGGNPYRIDRKFEPLISLVIAANKGDKQAQENLEAILVELERKGERLAFVIALRCIQAGERDQRSLVMDLNGPEALVVLRVLETIA